jgi:diguanylate cyclase
MNYQHSKEESAEYLRLALPLMTRQDAAFHPVSYAVWYEYVSGINGALKDAADVLLAQRPALDEAAVKSLFERHVACINSAAATTIADSFQRILGEITHTTGEAAAEATTFGETLQQLRRDSAHPGQQVDLDMLLAGTQAMQNSIGTLTTRLNESQQEITQLRNEVSRAREASLTDAMTGLINRHGFDQILTACLATITQSPTATGPCLLMGDIDHFKQVNDTYGHLFGDKVIRTVADIIRQNVKGRDTAARFGGEEFIILLPDTPLSGAHALAEHIRSAIERSRIKRGGNSIEMASVTLSIGVAHYHPGESAHDLIERADRALYASKQAGRNRVSVATA